MRWSKSCFLTAGAAVIACLSPPPPARSALPLPVLLPAAAATAPWPDVARAALAEKSGAQDAVVVVAVEPRPAQPGFSAVHVSGDDWARFFRTVLGVPPDRVTVLFDPAATRSAVSSALRASAARVAPGGRLWFVALGHSAVAETEIAAAVGRAVQVISVLDVVPEDTAAPPRPSFSPTHPGAPAPITFSIGRALPLPGASRLALSYLIMGALRGWGDRDHDGRVTASEAAAYVDLTLRLLFPPGSSRPSVTTRTDLVCSELTTLSVAREPAPNVLEIAPRVPLGPHADPERLASALEAIRVADTQLARARSSGLLGETAEPDEPRLTGEGVARHVEVVPMPPQVEATLRVRLEQAKYLGGPVVREAAPLLVEAGRLSLAYGWLDEVKQILTPVLEARCGADAAGHQAWENLFSVSNWTGETKDAARLVSMDCAYDEASASAIDSIVRPMRWADRTHRARRVYERAEQESDETLARCTWTAAAAQYAESWWSDSEHFDQVEPALNGAYAYQKLGRTDEAAVLYQSYVRKQGGTRAGEGNSNARARRVYTVQACSTLLAIASREPRHFPGYFAACRNVNCAGIDRATCARIKPDTVAAPLGSSPAAEPERARMLSLAAHDREELAGWELTDTARATRLREASERYASAEAAWAAIIERGEVTADPGEAARRVAEAAVRRLVVDLEAGAEVTKESIENARKLARRARDVSADERSVEPARLLVELADELLASEQRAFAASHGERGVAPRAQVRREGERDEARVVRDELPMPVAAAIAARDEYLARVPATFAAGEGRYRLAYEAAHLQFLYGHFVEARQRLELPYSMECGRSAVAHEAWALLISMATLEVDVARTNALTLDAAVCPCDVETRIRADRMRKPVFDIPFFLVGRDQLKASEALPKGPQRRALRREAAAIFRVFVEETPDREEAPESARLAAELYAELEEHARALEMYRVFVDRYAGVDRVRIADVEKAYAALAMLHARLGHYRAQALVLVEESKQKRLPAKVRASAALKARELRADRDGRGLAAALAIGG